MTRRGPVLPLMLAALIAIPLLAACAGEDSRRTALDPPSGDDTAVRRLANEIIHSAEACAFDRIDEIIGTGAHVVLDHVSPDDPSGLEPFYYAITHCEVRIDYEDVKIDHALYEGYADHPDAVSVGVHGRLRAVASEMPEWTAFDSKYYFDKGSDGAWRLVSSWFPG